MKHMSSAVVTNRGRMYASLHLIEASGKIFPNYFCNEGRIFLKQIDRE